MTVDLFSPDGVHLGQAPVLPRIGREGMVAIDPANPPRCWRLTRFQAGHAWVQISPAEFWMVAQGKCRDARAEEMLRAVELGISPTVHIQRFANGITVETRRMIGSGCYLSRALYERTLLGAVPNRDPFFAGISHETLVNVWGEIDTVNLAEALERANRVDRQG